MTVVGRTVPSTWQCSSTFGIASYRSVNGAASLLARIVGGMRVDGGVAATVEPRLAASLTEAADGPEPRKHAARDAGCRALSDGGRGTGLVLLRWRDSDAPTEATVGRRLREEGVVPYAWSNGPGDRYAGHDHGYDKVLMCAA